MPDRDYYLKTDERSLTLRTKSAAHVARVFQLLGDTPAIAAANAQTVLRVETGLANGQMSRVERRNPDSTYHRLPLATLKEMTPSWPWDAYFKQMGVAQIADLNIAAPGYFSALERQLASVPLNDWQAYLRWHTARLASPYLSAACVDADFAFFSRTLAGAQQLPPRLADLDELARDLEGHRVLRIAEEVAGANPDRRIVAPSFHGVDDSGRLFDAKGNRRDWWTRPADGQGTGLPGLVAGL